MLTFNYKAKNIQGTILHGQIQASNHQAVVAALKQKGYYLLSVQAQSQISAILGRKAGLGSRVSTKQKAIFTHQLETLLKAGMKITAALRTLAKQTENKHLTSVITQLYSDIELSSSLSDAMSKHPRIFPKVYTAIIEAAEQSGSLVETLSVLANQLKTQASVRARIRGAMIYPVFLLFVSVLVVGALMTFVIPKFLELFISENQSLPLPTKILIVVTNSLRNFWWLFMLLIAGIIGFLMTALKNKRFKLIFDSMLLRAPLVGVLNRKLQLVHFARTLGSLLNGGVRIISAVNTTKGTTANTAFAKEIECVEEDILKGSTLAKTISQQQHFSELTANMIAVGEDTGTLPEMLLEIADMYDEESESAISSMTTLLGPLMIVVLGLIIGFVVLAILMPIFETSTMIG